jgi:hypothetical protein
MYTRRLLMNLRPESAQELTRITEAEIIPLLRRQKGFRDVVTSIAPERSQAAVFLQTEQGV